MGKKDLGFSGFFDNDGHLGWYNAAGVPFRVITVDTSDNVKILQDLAELGLDNNVALTGRNAADSADVNMIKVSTTDDIEFGADLVPDTDSMHNIGTASARPATIFADTVRAAAFTIDGTDSIETFVDSVAMTPVPTGASGTITTETSTGRWCRIGPLVFVVAKVIITDVGTGSGDLTITLPAACPAAANISLDQPLALHTESVTEASVQLSAKIVSNTKTIKFYDVKTNAAADITDVENGTFEIAGCYLAE